MAKNPTDPNAAQAKAEEEQKAAEQKAVAEAKAAAQAKAEESDDEVPTVPVRGKDCPGVPKDVRSYIDKEHGPGFRVLTINVEKKLAYIENAQLGMKIELP